MTTLLEFIIIIHIKYYFSIILKVSIHYIRIEENNNKFINQFGICLPILILYNIKHILYAKFKCNT